MVGRAGPSRSRLSTFALSPGGLRRYIYAGKPCRGYLRGVAYISSTRLDLRVGQNLAYIYRCVVAAAIGVSPPLFHKARWVRSLGFPPLLSPPGWCAGGLAGLPGLWASGTRLMKYHRAYGLCALITLPVSFGFGGAYHGACEFNKCMSSCTQTGWGNWQRRR